MMTIMMMTNTKYKTSPNEYDGSDDDGDATGDK